MQNERISKILAAIENSKYKSRTIQGIAKETGISLEEVENTLKNDSMLNVNVMTVPGLRKNNNPLYVTVERYKKETPIAVRILNLIKDEECCR